MLPACAAGLHGEARGCRGNRGQRHKPRFDRWHQWMERRPRINQREPRRKRLWTGKPNATVSIYWSTMIYSSKDTNLGLVSIAAVFAAFIYTIAKADSFGAAIDDPVFGHYFYTEQASFERVPFLSLGAACLKYERDFYPTSAHPPAYLYGLYEYGSTRISIIGLDGGATLFVRRGDDCARTNPVVALRQNFSPASRRPDEPVMSRSEVVDVFSDLLDRFTRAFRGKKQFFVWLDEYTEAVQRSCLDPSRQTCPPTWHSLPSYLQIMLNRFRSQPPD